MNPMPTRRTLLAATGALIVARPSLASSPAMEDAIRRLTGSAPLRQGRVQIDLPELVENGNGVPVTISADSPMTAADHVTALALFTERNPAPEVAVFRFGHRAGKARVATRLRLSTSQQVVAIALMSDGSAWSRRMDVIVTLAACVES
jgi:sulfur-oxidizing protein SoxY